MRPYYENGGVRIFEGDALETMRVLPDASYDLILTDPPYFRVKGEWWDRQWDDSAAFLAWMEELADEWRRLLKPNGSLFVFASPQMAYGVEGLMRERFALLNNVRWYKQFSMAYKNDEANLRAWMPLWEAVFYAEHKEDPYEAAEKALHREIYAAVAAKITTIRESAGLSKGDVDEACSPSRKRTGLCYRWEEGACLPTRDQFAALCEVCRAVGDYDSLRVEYDAARVRFEAERARHEELRRVFALDHRHPMIDRWDYASVPFYPGKHVCEKPLPMLSDMIEATTRPGAKVLDCFAGSGATLEAARDLGRQADGIEIQKQWCERAAVRLSQTTLFAMEAA